MLTQLLLLLFDLVLIVALARACGWLAARLGQPSVVGEIMAGILLGPSVAGLIHLSLEGVSAPLDQLLFPAAVIGWLKWIGVAGLALFTFDVSSNLRWAGMAGRLGQIAWVVAGSFVVPLLGGVLVAPLLYELDGFAAAPAPLAFALIVGAMLSVTALPVAAKILAEKQLLDQPLGAIAVAAASVVTVAMFLATEIGVSIGTGQVSATRLASPLVCLLAIALGGRGLAWLGQRWTADARPRSAVLGVVSLVLAGVVMGGIELGLHPIVSAFVFGAVLSTWAPAVSSMARLRTVTNVALLPLFFAYSGLLTDFAALQLSTIHGALLLALAAIVTKLLGTSLAARVAGLSWHEGWILGSLMNCRGLLILVVGVAALGAGVIGDALHASGVAVALLTTMMTGPLLDKLAPSEDPAGAGVSD